MKLIVLMSVLAVSLGSNAAETAAKKTLPINKAEVKKVTTTTTTTTAKSVVPGKKEEDCDDKAKKPIEIKEETISLSGNTGCSLDEIK